MQDVLLEGDGTMIIQEETIHARAILEDHVYMLLQILVTLQIFLKTPFCGDRVKSQQWRIQDC